MYLGRGLFSRREDADWAYNNAILVLYMNSKRFLVHDTLNSSSSSSSSGTHTEELPWKCCV